MFRKFVKISEISKYLDISGKWAESIGKCNIMKLI